MEPKTLITLTDTENEDSVSFESTVPINVLAPLLKEAAAGCARVVSPKDKDQMARHLDITNKLDMLLYASTKTASATRGRAGEVLVQDILSRRFTVIDFHKTARSTDMKLVVNIDKTTKVYIAVEVKDYSHPVPTKELDKFHSDLITTGVAGALFISLQSPITGSPDFAVDSHYNGVGLIPVVYLYGNSPQLIQAAALLIEAKIMTNNVRIDDIDYDKLTIAVTKLSDQISEFSTVRAMITKLSTDVSSTCHTLYTLISRLESSLENTIFSCKSILNDIKAPDDCIIPFKDDNHPLSNIINRIIKSVDGKWQHGPKGSVNATNNITITCTSRRAKIIFPATGRLSLALELFNIGKLNMEMKDKNIIIPICNESLDTIERLCRGGE